MRLSAMTYEPEGLLALGLDFITPTAKIDDCGGAKFGETLVRLRAAKEKAVCLAQIGNSGECDFLCESASNCGAFDKTAENCARVARGAITRKGKITMHRRKASKGNERRMESLNAGFLSQNEKIGRKYKRAMELAETRPLQIDMMRKCQRHLAFFS
jgi:hypothetical protein